MEISYIKAEWESALSYPPSSFDRWDAAFGMFEELKLHLTTFCIITLVWLFDCRGIFFKENDFDL